MRVQKAPSGLKLRAQPGIGQALLPVRVQGSARPLRTQSGVQQGRLPVHLRQGVPPAPAAQPRQVRLRVQRVAQQVLSQREEVPPGHMQLLQATVRSTEEKVRSWILLQRGSVPLHTDVLAKAGLKVRTQCDKVVNSKTLKLWTCVKVANSPMDTEYVRYHGNFCHRKY